jgi:hypothetical protein
MRAATRYRIRVSTYLFAVAAAAFTVKGLLLVGWMLAGCPSPDEYDYDVRNGKVYAVHRRPRDLEQFSHVRRAPSPPRLMPLSPQITVSSDTAITTSQRSSSATLR